MHITERAKGVLRQTEAKLRDLLSEATTSSDYSSVVQIASWAKALHDLLRSHSEQESQLVAKSFQSTGTAAVPISPRKRLLRHKAQDGYPRFFKQGDQLIRVAWSRREKKEYLHKAPHPTVKAVINAVSENGADGRVFSTDQLLPVYDFDGSKAPDYQVYVVISLLKQTGLIDAHGRQGYSIPRITEFKNAFEVVWTKLPEEGNRRMAG